MTSQKNIPVQELRCLKVGHLKVRQQPDQLRDANFQHRSQESPELLTRLKNKKDETSHSLVKDKATDNKCLAISIAQWLKKGGNSLGKVPS